ncbi:MAG: tRNA pseudouridine(55) synthase TruB [Pseudomonadota bacterium]
MGRRKKGDPIHGWMVVDKPIGATSTQVVSRVRRHLDAQKAGHGGTLDPLATGVLPIALGEATKTVNYALHGDKSYAFTVRWGAATDTDDAEGEVIKTSDSRPTEQQIRDALSKFTGLISQVPPKYSAIKIDGERAYDLARDGVEVEIPTREVEIFDFDLVEIVDTDHARFEVACGAGTYVRALARDLALELGTLAHVSQLRRLSAGPFTAKDAIPLDEIEDSSITHAREQLLLPVEAALDDIPALALTRDEAQKLRLGQSVKFLSRQDRHRLDDLDIEDEGEPILTMSDGKPVALAQLDGPEIKPIRVLNL